MAQEGKGTLSQLGNLPEDIFEEILSLLSWKDAIRLSILSRRVHVWKNLWRNCPKLLFDVVNLFGMNDDEINPKNAEHLAEVTGKFIDAVDNLLEVHQGTGVRILKVKFPLRSCHSSHLDRWVSFAVASHAKEIHFSLKLGWEGAYHPSTFDASDTLYIFPIEMFLQQSESFLEYLELEYVSLRPPLVENGLQTLRTLTLKSCNVTNNDLRNLLANCCNLEYLTIVQSAYLIDIQISAPFFGLKFLQVEQCPCLRRIDLKTPNLTTFEYSGHVVNLKLRGSLHLTTASFNLGHTKQDGLHYATSSLSRDLPHLNKLCLQFDVGSQMRHLLREIRSFDQLKSLVLFLFISDHKMALKCVKWFMMAAPLLEQFELHLFNIKGTFPGDSAERLPGSSDNSLLHSHLKAFKFCGFCGDAYQIQIAEFVLANATVLDLMTIDINVRRYQPFDNLDTDHNLLCSLPKGKRFHDACTHLSEVAPAQVRLLIK